MKEELYIKLFTESHAELISEYRKSTGKTPNAVAVQSGITTRNYLYYESGEILPTDKTKVKLAQGFDKTFHDYMNDLIKKFEEKQKKYFNK